jgi:putative flippase GtrA
MHRLLEPIFHHVRREKRSIGAFLVIGTSCLLLTVGGYALLSRIMWPSGPHTLQYAMVIIFVTYVNYEANRFFTFQGVRNKTTLSRFVMVAVAAFILQNFIFWLGHDVLGLWDVGIILLGSAIVAFFTFAGHRLFTFRSIS